jgi:hypothetical protein
LVCLALITTCCCSFFCSKLIDWLFGAAVFSEFQADAEEARGAEQHGPAAAAAAAGGGDVLPCDIAPASLTQSLPGQRPLLSPATNT